MEVKPSNGLGGLVALLILGLMGAALIMAPPGWDGLLTKGGLLLLFIGFGLLIGAAAIIDKVREGAVQENEQRVQRGNDLPRLPVWDVPASRGRRYTPAVPEEHKPKLRVL